MAGLSDFRTDYVYNDEKSGEFKNVKIRISVEENKMNIDLSADELLDEAIIKNILNQLRGNILDRMNISIKDDCTITLNINKPSYIITIEDNDKIKIEEN